MKDAISAISALIGFLVLIICIWQKIEIETAPLRSLISFIICNLIGYSGLAIARIQLKNQGKSKSSPEMKSKHREAKAAANA